MANCLILGLAGAGKSTLVAELLRRGRLAHDADAVRGLGNWRDADGHAQDYQNNPAWLSRHQFIWNMPTMHQLLNGQGSERTVYLAGIATNALDAIPLFNRVVALDASAHTLRQRLTAPSRQTPYPFDCTEQYKTQLSETVTRFRKDMRRVGAIFINADLGIERVAENLIAAIEE